MNTPNIRFKGFANEWEQRKLNDITDVRDGTHDSPSYVEFGHPFITSKNVKDGYINYDDVQYISDNDFEQINRRSKVDVDDILMGMIGTIGNLALIREEPDFAIKNVALIKHTGISNPFFIYSYLQSNSVSKQLGNVLAGGTQNFISLRNIRELEISIPDMQEQNKIGACFANLDNLITLHQRKCDSLNAVKKYMLQKMFPQNGAKVPEIRFKGFTGVWEQRKLGEISDKITKKNKSVIIDEVFTNSAEFGIISQREFFDKDIANAENIAGYYVVEPNDFVYNPRISTTAPFGPIKRNKLGRTGAMSPLYYVFRPHDVDLTYLEWFFHTTCWHVFMRINGNSGARSDRFAITDKIFNEMPIYMPHDSEEQKLIGNYLSHLDNLITLHQRKCDSLKELKKFMLQNMFP